MSEEWKTEAGTPVSIPILRALINQSWQIFNDVLFKHPGSPMKMRLTSTVTGEMSA